MTQALFRPLLKRGNRKTFVGEQTIGRHKRHYFDYTASGLAFEPIESRLREVLETYANTHSKEASMAAVTEHYYNGAREQLKTLLGLDDAFAVLPCGCGATSAIKRLQEILGVYIPPATRKRCIVRVRPQKRPLVIVGPYEHHSNEISYREGICDTVRIGFNAEGEIDLEYMEILLQANRHREVIGAFCIASNVTGIVTPYQRISRLLRKYGAMVCFDAAASSPYMNVPSKLYDAMFLSPHKLLGGPGSCGLLVIRKSFIDEAVAPTFAGGGTVTYVNRSEHRFIDEKETREDAGTPGILQLIRAALAYQLRNELGFAWIKNRKKQLTDYLLSGLTAVPGCTVYGDLEKENLGIVSFNIEGIDPYALCAGLSEKWGVQTRAGCSCAGPYGHDLLGLADDAELETRPGWVRISIHYSQEIADIDYLLASIRKTVRSLGEKHENGVASGTA
ncbi:aminotransferase class V-fold PLP-dependent enzyme [Sulfurimonas sp. HSL-1656]|uniref:aminotransferase class V-fold PLP-dependent enzyme n=1 Tax=Thiomicrolovo subterrani TaxID=3131934 RepID=UPI0031F9A371